MPSEAHRAPKTLLVYLHAPEDKKLRDELDKHMSILQRYGPVKGWSKADIPAGSDARSVFAQYLNDADIILLLISVDFLSDDYYEVEIMPALARHNAHEALAIPILLRPTDWERLPFADLQWLPDAAKAVTLWEHMEEAFVCIATSIRKIVEGEEQSSVATSSTLPSLWLIPHRRNLFFSARERDLDELHNRFTKGRDGSLMVQAITGLPGQGKTELALEYAFRYRHEYQAIFWFRCDSQEELIADFLHVADLLRPPVERASEEQDIVTRVKERLISFSGRWLAIFDNAFDMSALDNFIPADGNGDALITTIDSTIGTFAHSLTLLGMSEDEGARFLLKRAKIKASNGDQMVRAKELSALLGGLPLALDQAGAYIEATRKSFANYIENYKVRLDRRGHNAQRRSPRTVTATFSLCFELVKQQNLVAGEILYLCAFLNAEAIPERLFVTGTPELGPLLQSLSSTQLEEALEDLQRYSLITQDGEKLSIHRLVQTVLEDGMNVDEKRQWKKRAVSAVSAIFPEVHFAVWSFCQEYLPQVQVCAELMRQQKEIECPEGASLLDRAGYYLYERSQYAAARSFFEQALEIQQRLFASPHPDTACTLAHLGALARSLGHYPEAEKYYHDAHALLEQMHDQVPLPLAKILDGQGELAQTQYDYAGAQQFYEQAFAIRQRTLPPDDPDIAVSLANLAGIHEVLEGPSLAESFYRQALEIYEKALVPNHPTVALVLSNFARFCGKQKKYTQAEQLFERAKVIREHVFGVDHPKVAGTLHNLASLYIDTGDLHKYIIAEQYIGHALKIWEQSYGTQLHPNVAASLRIYAKLYQKQHLYLKAEPLYKQALMISTQVSGPESVDLVPVLHGLGELYLDQNENDQAKLFLERALAISKKCLGMEHPVTRAIILSIARLPTQ